MPKYRKKPIVIEAFQMTLERRASNVDWPQWMHEAWQVERGESGSLQPTEEGTGDGTLSIVTLEGEHLVSWDDYIIQGVHGELYPCKPDIFDATYDLVEEDDASDHIIYVVCLGICGDKVFAHMKDTGPETAHGWNGPGGHVGEGESLEQAASREWEEEVSGHRKLHVPPSAWRRAFVYEGDGYRLWFLAAEIPMVTGPLTIDDLKAWYVHVDALEDGTQKCSDHFEKATRAAMEMFRRDS